MTIRVHLADDHTMFREGLASILASRADGIEVVGQIFIGTSNEPSCPPERA